MAKSRARQFAELLSGGAEGGGSIAPALVSDQANTSTGYFDLPAGTTAQRPASANSGHMRYNTSTGYVETYTSSGWSPIATPPSISTVSPTSFSGASGTSFTINGSFFDQSATVKFITAQGAEFSAASVSFVSTVQLVASTPQNFTVAQEPLSVKVINGSGLSVVLDSAIDCGGLPSWNTAAGSLGICYDVMRSGFSVAVSASDAETSVTYSVVSGAVPAGMSLNTSTGAISGTPNAVASDTTSNFTIRASDGINTSDRAFSITVKAPVTEVFSYTGSDQTFSVPSGLTKIQMALWGAAGGGGYGEGHSDAGGPGGFTDVTSCTVTPGDTLKVQVGQGGWRSSGAGPLSSTRPYPWGGRPSPRDPYNPGYGGGRSAVFKSNTLSAANCLAVAGGGGGAGGKGWAGTLPNNANKGGAGGGTTGRAGWYLHDGSQAGYNDGTQGTQTGIGSSGLGVNGAGVEAAQFKGGDAANPEGSYPSHGGNTQGGGGDGWYGGRASQYAHSGGGGGSGYINPTYATGTTSDSGIGGSTENSGPFNPPGTGDSRYANSAGVAVNNGTGNNGRVVITY